MTFFRRLCFAILLTTAGTFAMAQPGGGPPPPHGEPVPLMGLEWLIAGGAALGAFSLFRKKSRNNN